MVNAAGNKALAQWLQEVLEVQTHDAVVVLPNGDEAFVGFDGKCLTAYTYDEETEDPVYHARIRIVEETD